MQGRRGIVCCDLVAPSLVTEAMVKSVPDHAAWRSLSGSVAMQWQGSVSMSMVHIASKDHDAIPFLSS